MNLPERENTKMSIDLVLANINFRGIRFAENGASAFPPL
jgi:hypothetical protein